MFISDVMQPILCSDSSGILYGVPRREGESVHGEYRRRLDVQCTHSKYSYRKRLECFSRKIKEYL